MAPIFVVRVLKVRPRSGGLEMFGDYLPGKRRRVELAFATFKRVVVVLVEPEPVASERPGERALVSVE